MNGIQLPEKIYTEGEEKIDEVIEALNAIIDYLSQEAEKC